MPVAEMLLHVEINLVCNVRGVCVHVYIMYDVFNYIVDSCYEIDTLL